MLEKRSMGQYPLYQYAALVDRPLNLDQNLQNLLFLISINYEYRRAPKTTRSNSGYAPNQSLYHPHSLPKTKTKFANFCAGEAPSLSMPGSKFQTKTYRVCGLVNG